MFELRAKNMWWTRQIRRATVVGLTSVSLLAGESDRAFAERVPRPKVPKIVEPTEPQSNSSFDAAIRKMLKEAKSAENKGEIDRAVFLAERAAKISESSSSLVKSSKDVSPAATASYARVLRQKRAELAAKRPAAEASNELEIATVRSKRAADSRGRSVAGTGQAEDASNAPELATVRSTTKPLPTAGKPDPDQRYGTSPADSTAIVSVNAVESDVVTVSRPRREARLTEEPPSLPASRDSDEGSVAVNRVATRSVKLAKTEEVPDSPAVNDDDVESTLVQSSQFVPEESSSSEAAVPDLRSRKVITLGTGEDWDQSKSSSVTPISSSIPSSDEPFEAPEIPSVAGESASVDIRDSVRSEAVRRATRPAETWEFRDLRESVRDLPSTGSDDLIDKVESDKDVDGSVTEPSTDSSKESSPSPILKLRPRFRGSNQFEKKPVHVEESVKAQDRIDRESIDVEDILPATELTNSKRTSEFNSTTASDDAKPATSDAVSTVVEMIPAAEATEPSQPRFSGTIKLRTSFRDSQSKSTTRADSTEKRDRPEEKPVVATSVVGNLAQTDTTLLPTVEKTQSLQPRPTGPIKLRSSFRDSQLTTSLAHDTEQRDPSEVKREQAVVVVSHEVPTDAVKVASDEAPPPASGYFKLRPSFRDPQIKKSLSGESEKNIATKPESTIDSLSATSISTDAVRVPAASRTTMIQWRSAKSGFDVQPTDEIKTDRSSADVRRSRGKNDQAVEDSLDSSTENGQSSRHSISMKRTSSTADRSSNADLAASSKAVKTTARRELRGSLWDHAPVPSIETDSGATRSGAELGKKAPLPPRGNGVEQTSFSRSDRRISSDPQMQSEQCSQSVAYRSELSPSIESSSPLDAVSDGSSQHRKKTRPQATEDDHAASTRAILASGPIQRLATLAGIPTSTASAMLGAFGVAMLIAGLWMIRATMRIKQS